MLFLERWKWNEWLFLPLVHRKYVFISQQSLRDSSESVHRKQTVITCVLSCPAQCSSTCAGGFQRRVVVCQDENGYPANNCEDRSRPSEQRSCESGPCPQWIYGNWGEVRRKATSLSLSLASVHMSKTRKSPRCCFLQCTKPCGGGIKTRLVVCQRPNGERFNDLSCEIHDKPPDREQCNTQPCSSSPHWSTDPWSSVRSWKTLLCCWFFGGGRYFACYIFFFCVFIFQQPHIFLKHNKKPLWSHSFTYSVTDYGARVAHCFSSPITLKPHPLPAPSGRCLRVVKIKAFFVCLFLLQLKGEVSARSPCQNTQH